MSRVIVGLSGGVDSAVAAWLLKQQGHEVLALSIRFWEDAAVSSYQHEECLKITQSIGMELIEADATQLFSEKVIRTFSNDYFSGKTPNPCIPCNPNVKWKILQEQMQKFDYDYMATGHYVRKIFRNGRWLLKKAADAVKDQSYMLWQLTPSQIERTLFPLADFSKQETKKLAHQIGLSHLAEKQESYGVCFLQKQNYKDWLQTHFPEKLVPGNIVDESGKIIGQHQGIACYTIGTSLKEVTGNQPLFVLRMIPAENLIVAAEKEKLFFTELLLHDCRFYVPEIFAKEAVIHIRIRGKEQEHEAVIQNIHEDKMQIALPQPVFAPAPGQSGVFYHDDCVVGGGEYDGCTVALF